jgi:hypothetical protein
MLSPDVRDRVSRGATAPTMEPDWVAHSAAVLRTFRRDAAPSAAELSNAGPLRPYEGSRGFSYHFLARQTATFRSTIAFSP